MSTLFVDPANVSSRRFDYLHLLLLVERFKLLSTLPVNTRVVCQVENDIDLTITNDADAFLQTIDYSGLRKQMSDNNSVWEAEEEKTASQDNDHHEYINKCRSALLSAMQSMQRVIHQRYGTGSHIDFNASVNQNYNNEYVVYMANAENQINSPNTSNQSSEYAVIHQLIKRPLSNASKINEAKHKIQQAITHRAALPNHTHVRLDYLDLNERSIPAADLYILKGRQDCIEVNLSHNQLLYIPNGFCDTFYQLRILNLSNNQHLYHIPAEISKLSRLRSLQLIDCKNLLSLPLTLPAMYDLEELALFGCTNLSFPPHSVAVRACVATQTGMSVAGVRAIQQYISDPQSWMTFNLDAAKKMLKHLETSTPAKLFIHVPSFRKALAQNYIEYEIVCLWGQHEWAVWRRYSQFLTLSEKLEQSLGSVLYQSLPQLPGKTLSLHEDDPQLCEQRRAAMNSLCERLSEIEEQREIERRQMIQQQTHITDKAGLKAAQEAMRRHIGLAELPYARTFFEVEKHEVV